MRITTALARLSAWMRNHPSNPDQPKALAAMETLVATLGAGVSDMPTPKRSVARRAGSRDITLDTAATEVTSTTNPCAPSRRPLRLGMSQTPSCDIPAYVARTAPVALSTLGDQVTADAYTTRTWASALFLARRTEPVLILGESGTGKESLARALHGDRPADKFVAVNCGAIPDGLVESLLFGHKRGAFTGATQDHTGAFERSTGGTLFLDEIGDLPIAAQTKILRAIQESTIQPVGHTKTIPFNTRIVAATHKLGPNTQLGKDAGFRLDLYHRLAVHILQTRPLRDRSDDILLIASKLTNLTFDYSAQSRLISYTYPGNVRELRNVVTRSEASAQMRGALEISGVDIDFLRADEDEDEITLGAESEEDTMSEYAAFDLDEDEVTAEDLMAQVYD